MPLYQNVLIQHRQYCLGNGTSAGKIWTIETVQIEITIQVTILQYPLDFCLREITERIDLLSLYKKNRQPAYILQQRYSV